MIVENSIYKSNNIVLAMVRNGSRYLSDMCEEHSIEKENRTVDMGIKLERLFLIIAFLFNYFFNLTVYKY